MPPSLSVRGRLCHSFRIESEQDALSAEQASVVLETCGFAPSQPGPG